MGEPRRRPDPPAPAYPAYARDLVAWAEANAVLLRRGRLTEIDAVNVAEELEDLGKSERRALGSHIRNLILHVLKWEYQPARRTRSWRYSIDNAHREIQVILADSSSLAGGLDGVIEAEYPTARRHAATQTGLAQDAFPEECPYGTEQLLAEGFPDTERDPTFLRS